MAASLPAAMLPAAAAMAATAPPVTPPKNFTVHQGYHGLDDAAAWAQAASGLVRLGANCMSADWTGPELAATFSEAGAGAVGAW